MRPMKNWKKWQKILLIGVVIAGLLVCGAAAVWGVGGSSPAEAAVEPFVQSSETVTVGDGRWLSFTPANASPTVGFIFYPGGKVDHLAYAPALYRIAEAGYLVVDVPMPFDLAVIDPNKAQKVIEAYPEIESWVIGGHSLGGAMAARFVYEYPDLIDGLALWAAYPADSNSLADLNLPVLSLYGTMDGVASPGKIERRFELLPADTIYVALEGGNHAQFGYYGLQNRDNAAAIPREAQQDLIVEEMLRFLGMFE
jgi:pimeloyl-ACP methyl ester carboxylesterase